MSSTTVQTEGEPLLPKPSVSPDRGAVVDTNVDRKRIGVPSTVFFIVTGVMLTIPLPVALKQTGLISGLMIMFVIAGTISYMSVALGRCWIILQERWPDKYGPNVLVRRPYPSIAFEATNSRFITYAVEVAIDITNFGVGVVDLLISAQSLDILIPGKLSTRVWVLICAGITLPMVWLGAPMESWFVGWAGGIGCVLASLLLLIAVVMAGTMHVPAGFTPSGLAASVDLPAVTTSFMNATTQPQLETLTAAVDLSGVVSFKTFWIGASTLIFAFAGLSIFPTFQHDMKEPKRWPIAALSAYAIIVSFGAITAIVGYEVFGLATTDDILENVKCHGPHPAALLARVTSAIFVAVYLCNGVVAFIPVTADIEEGFSLPRATGIRHLIIRTVTVALATLLAAVVPKFDSYLPLVGSTGISLNNFCFPAYFHLRLNGQRMSLGEKVLNWEIVAFGVVAVFAGTYSSILGLIDSGDSVSLC